MVFGPRVAAVSVRDSLNINIGLHQLPVVVSARNLGVIIDSELSFEKHIKSLLQKSFFKLKLLYSSRHVLSCDVRKLLCDSLILSCFSYCSQVYWPCLTKFWMSKIQRVQNSCLRFIYSIPRRHHVSHALRFANWLNMENRFHLQTSVLIHKILIEKKPSYLHRRIKFRCDVHNINLRHRHTISCPSHKLQLYKSSFTYLCFKIYNSIPEQFKILNMHIFKARYKGFLLNSQFCIS